MGKEKIFAVFGLGRFGVEVCSVLAEKGYKVIAVDMKEEPVQKIKDVVMKAVLIDSTDEQALRDAGIQAVDLAVIAMGGNIESSILTTLLLKNIGVPYIVARAISDAHGQVLREIGATEVIGIEREQGRRLANRIAAPDVVDIIPISGDLSVAEMRVPAGFLEKSLADLGIRKKYNVNIVSVNRVETEIDDLGNPKRKEIIFSPKPADMLKANDIMVLWVTRPI